MSALIVCADLDAALAKILDRIKGAEYRIFQAEKEELNVAEARAVIAEAFVASEREKYLVIKAHGYNDKAQNALLKLLEEPPPNISFYLIAPSRAVFLPTVRSRLPLEKIAAPKLASERLIDYEHLDLEAVYEFNKKHRYLSGDRAKSLIEEAFRYFAARKIESVSLRSRFLKAFSQGFIMLSTNSSAANALMPILLLFLEANAKTARRY
ncbi:DNA polymerase III subunit delta' [Campylobacterota bacterium]|nr:DNA polymerase III subunit delta' [Campylobacterota bacterium]